MSVYYNSDSIYSLYWCRIETSAIIQGNGKNMITHDNKKHIFGFELCFIKLTAKIRRVVWHWINATLTESVEFICLKVE